MNADLDAVVAGHICVDLIPTFDESTRGSLADVLVPGKLINVGPMVASTGGAVSNTGRALIKLGINTKLMGKVGDDLLGRAILELLAGDDGGEGMAIVEGESSSYTVVLAPPGTDRIFLHHPGANDTFVAADVDYELVSHSRLFHLGYPPIMRQLFENEGTELADICRRCKDLGVTVSLDMALPDPASPAGRADWSKILQGALPHVDVFLPSAEEILYMLRRDLFDSLSAKACGAGLLDLLTTEQIAELASTLLDWGAKIVVIKCGEKGLYLATAPAERVGTMGAARVADVENWSGRQLWAETLRVENVASATGAGDCTIAGFLAAMLRGESVETSLRCGCSVGAQNVMVMDAVSGVRSWQETREMLAANPPRNCMELDSSDWRFDDDLLVWTGPRDRAR